MHYTYSHWDGSQDETLVSIESMLGALAEDLLETTDVEAVVTQAAIRGLTPRDGAAIPGLEQLLAEIHDRLRDTWSQPGIGDCLAALEQWLHQKVADRGEILTASGTQGSEAPDVPGDDRDQPNGSGSPAKPSADDPGVSSRLPEASGFDDNSSARLLSWLKTDAIPEAAGRLAPCVAGQSYGLDTDLPIPHGGATAQERNAWPQPIREAFDFIDRMSALRAVERQIIAARNSGDLSRIDPAGVAHIAGERIGTALEQLTTVLLRLESAGYIAPDDGFFSLTAAGRRVIADRLLRETLASIRASGLGRRTIPSVGAGGDASGTTRRYKYGDALMLDIKGTILNAVRRTGGGVPVSLSPQDFEVIDTESPEQGATVLLLDISRSMPVRGCFQAGKKTVLALHRLLELEYPRDALYVAVFSDRAEQVRPERIVGMTWADRQHGTNFQQGLSLARRLLEKHKRASRQIILVTDGEPTAHMERDEIFVGYPAAKITLNATLQEVRQCTRAKILINTYLLGNGRHLRDFVEQVAALNGGKVVCAEPERLGDHVLWDYVAGRAGRFCR